MRATSGLRGVIRALLVVALLLAGCASSSPTRWTTPATERDRAACLEAGGIWVETAVAYVCYSQPDGERT